MNAMELMRARHSVRQYSDKPIPQEVRTALDSFVEELNAENGMHIQILYDEPECFSSRKAHYGKFENANNYIALVGPKGDGLEEKAGYLGEKIVLAAQDMGLNSCWVALTHGKSRAVIEPGEKEVIIISLGYGETQGSMHKSKDTAKVSDMAEDDPDWYKYGIEAALLAPTAINQQKFKFQRNGNTVSAKTAGLGPCLKIDLGIVKCHFELGAGRENFMWE